MELLVVDERTTFQHAEVLENQLAQLGPGERFQPVFEKLDAGEQARAVHLAVLNRQNLDALVEAAKGDATWMHRWAAFRDWAIARPELASEAGRE